MKTENTLENKAKFFAQYWGQKVLSSSYHYPNIYEVNRGNIRTEEQDFLELKPISKISDEDAIEVARIVSPSLFFGLGNNNKHYVDRNTEPDWISIKHNKKVISVDIDFDGYIYEYHEDLGYTRPSKSFVGTDFLRSKGYALPYMDLSVKDLIEYGWVKLEE